MVIVYHCDQTVVSSAADSTMKISPMITGNLGNDKLGNSNSFLMARSPTVNGNIGNGELGNDNVADGK